MDCFHPSSSFFILLHPSSSFFRFFTAACFASECLQAAEVKLGLRKPRHLPRLHLHLIVQARNRMQWWRHSMHLMINASWWEAHHTLYTSIHNYTHVTCTINYTKLNQNAFGSCISKFLAFESSLALGHVSVISGLSPLVRHSQRNALSPVSPAESYKVCESARTETNIWLRNCYPQ